MREILGSSPRGAGPNRRSSIFQRRLLGTPEPDRYQVFHVDVFTRVAFEGNSAGVVLDARGLDDDQMQRIARELGHSETAFVLPPDSEDHAVRTRFFTPTCETPDCGHATVAAHHLLSKLGLRGPERLPHKTGVGVRDVELVLVDGDWRVVIHQGPPTFQPALAAPQVERVRAALALPAGGLAPHLPLQVVGTGRPKLLVPVQDRRTLDALKPDDEALLRLSRAMHCSGVVPFVVFRGDETSTEARHFAPLLGIQEDPVTGNASGPLGAYVVRHGLAADGASTFRFPAHQGRSVGRPGVVHVEVDRSGTTPHRVRIGGDALVLMSSVLRRRALEPVTGVEGR